jgi:DNA-binding transcriptional LysR family regulator
MINEKEPPEPQEETAGEFDDLSDFHYFDWQKVKTFYYIAKSGSFTKAAQGLRLSQPSLSRQVAQLEDHLGCPLLIRRKKGIELTRKGEELLEIVGTIFVDLTGFVRYMHAATSKEKGKRRRIRISATHAVNNYILGDLILEYAKDRPDLVFELVGNDQVIDLFLNDVDIAIRPYDPNAHHVQQELLFTLEKKLYASTNYLEKYGEPQTVEDLKHHRLIAPMNPHEYPYSDMQWILRLGMTGNKMHVPVFTSNSIESLINAAQNDIGIAAAYQEMKIVKESRLKNILPAIRAQKIEDYIVYPDYFKEDTEILTLKNYLKQKLRPKEN